MKRCMIRKQCISPLSAQLLITFRNSNSNHLTTLRSLTLRRHSVPFRIHASHDETKCTQNTDIKLNNDVILDNNGLNTDFLVGNVYLLATSILWGSYTPTLRYLFDMPSEISPSFVAASRGVIQASILLLALGIFKSKNNSTNNHPTLLPLSTTKAFLPPIILASLEIGAYNTLGTLLQTWGISASTATRSAFLVQATALWTPILSALLGKPPSLLLWLSCLVALLSTGFVTLDQTFTSTSSYDTDALFQSLTTGDLATLGAALCYSLSTVRLPEYTPLVSPLQLAAGKSTVLAVLAVTTVLVQASFPSFFSSTVHASSETVSSHAPVILCGGSLPVTALLLLLWSAVGPGACSAYLHVKGQSLVGPTDAQVVFSTTPLWSALIAAVCLPGERVGTLTWLGGAGMLGAGLLAAVASSSSNDNSSGGGGLSRGKKEASL